MHHSGWPHSPCKPQRPSAQQKENTRSAINAHGSLPRKNTIRSPRIYICNNSKNRFSPSEGCADNIPTRYFKGGFLCACLLSYHCEFTSRSQTRIKTKKLAACPLFTSQLAQRLMSLARRISAPPTPRRDGEIPAVGRATAPCPATTPSLNPFLYTFYQVLVPGSQT